mgnify:CR=1 FL=1
MGDSILAGIYHGEYSYEDLPYSITRILPKNPDTAVHVVSYM